MAMGILVSSAFTGFNANAEMKPIKIGLMTDLTSFLSLNGIAIKEGSILALEEVNYKVAGRPIEYIIEDSASKPALAMDKARKLVESDKVSMILGPFHGGAVAAVAGYAGKIGIPQLVTWYSIPAKQMLTYKWSWAPFGTLEQMSVPVGHYIYDKLGYRTGTTMGTDYVAGRRFMAGATDTFEEKGGKIIQQQWIPLGTKDIAPYITALKKADFLSPWLAGITATVGIRQIKEFNVPMPVVMPQTGSLAHPLEIKEHGDLGLGIITSDAYVWTYDTPENKAFVERYKKRWGEVPAGCSYGGYMSMQVVLEALKKAGDDTSPRGLAKALDETKLQGYLGDFYFADARVGIGNYIIHKAIKVGGDYPYQTEVLAKYQIRPELVGRELKYRVNKVEMLK
jgi:branched-chain amino acid transport system substrate-binding protein